MSRKRCRCSSALPAIISSMAILACYAVRHSQPCWLPVQGLLRDRSVHRLDRDVMGRKAMLTPQLVAANSLPSCLGFWKSEYGVSYGYGGAVASSGALILQQASATLPLAVLAHAFCLVLYGVRLNVFLLYRELCIPKFKKFRDKIEARARSRGGRLKRLPFIVSISLLYLGLAAPAVIAAQAGGAASFAYRCCVAAMYGGLMIAALGDTYKSWCKAQRGEAALVTGGLFALLRHPNYTGEQLLWTANFAAGFVSACAAWASSGFAAAVAGWLLMSLVGMLGINFVLMQATTKLEARQAETHGSSDDYRRWVSSSWSGFTLPGKA